MTWERVNDTTDRMAVPGGWVVRSVGALCVVPDAEGVTP